MMELEASVHLGDWMVQNNIRKYKYISFIGHNTNTTVYGGLFDTDKGLLFHRHKWSEVNTNKSVPKACAQVQYSCKLVSEDIWNSFKELSDPEYLSRYVNDMKSI